MADVYGRCPEGVEMRNLITCSVVSVLSGVIAADTPSSIELEKILASDGEGYDYFGGSVSISGDTAIVGASEDGAAYIYQFDGSQWIEVTKLLASDGGNNDYFGSNVSIFGDTAIVGAPEANGNSSHDSGYAYIYQFDGSQWVEVTKLLASDGEHSDWFGGNVSISGDTAIVGAHRDDDNGSYDSGSAYIYQFDGSQWIEVTKLLASDGESYDYFGESVSISGDTAIVGAPEANGSSSYSGSAYIYQFDGSQWIEVTKLLASDGESYDSFGGNVSISGDTAIVGASGDDDNGSSSGSAYIYQFDGSQWIEVTKLLASDGESSDSFGGNVSISGDTAIVGAIGGDDNGSSSGSAYIYQFDGSQWIEVTKLLASDGESSDYLGGSVSISGDTAIAGAISDDDNGYKSGAAYVFIAGVVDCNGNGIEDSIDVKSGFSYDCDQNGVPDECQPDCDGDGYIDPCDNEGDCDSDGIPDNCETDCNGNNYPDDCDIMHGISQDIDNDGIPDECQDCNNNGVLDSEDIENGTSSDVDVNGIPDECQIPVTWIVDDDGKADFDSIAEAVAMAGFFDEIIVRPGTYSGLIDISNKQIWLHSSDGPETTIIDGDGVEWGISCSYAGTNETRIEGFTITNCYGEWPQGGGMGIEYSSPMISNCIFDSNSASGLSLDRSSPMISNCIFDSNSATWNGGGIHCAYDSYPVISGCRFINNSTSSDSYPGGGIISVYNSHPIISDTLFCGNFPDQISGSWTDNGGTCISITCDDSDGDGVPDECGTVDDGVHHVPEEFPTIQQAINAAGDHDEIVVAPGTYSECEDTINYFTAIMNPLGKRLWIHSSGGADVTIIDASKCNGGVFVSGETTDLVVEGFTFTSTENMWPIHMFLSAATFRDCIFTDATNTYGAVYCRRSQPEFEGCKFTNNASYAFYLSDWQGGWMPGTAKLTNCTFSNNGSGGNQNGSCIYITDNIGLELSNCLFENSGGSSIIYTSSGDDTVITDCVFRNNDTSAGSSGDRIFNAYISGNFNMQSCLFESNRSTYQLQISGYKSEITRVVSDSVFKNNVGSGIQVYSPNQTIIENSTVKGNSVGGISGALGQVTITNTTVCGNEEYQIDNDDWIDGGGNTVTEVCFNDCQAADITDDGIVDISDILAILGYWGSSIPAGDVDGNGVVDIGDLLMVVGNWGPCE
jgi:hypothetical protein